MSDVVNNKVMLKIMKYYWIYIKLWRIPVFITICGYNYYI